MEPLLSIIIIIIIINTRFTDNDYINLTQQK